jgi:[acyl-carrier-protein] S-malonyltransferase
MPEDSAALLFPGQGSQAVTMLDELTGLEPFRRRYRSFTDVLGYDLLADLRAGRTSIHANLTGSLMILLANVISLDLLRQSGSLRGPIIGMAGYSVGQWVALHAAGAMTFEQLVRVVHRRATVMDDCAAANPGRMIAVIGVGEEDLENCCSQLRDRGVFAAIANYNAVGQFTLSVRKEAVPEVMQEVQSLKPMKAIELQAAGPCHSE